MELSEEKIREIIRDEIYAFNKVAKFEFGKRIQIRDGKHIQLGRTIGTKIGTAIDQKLGLWDKTPIVQPSSTGEATGVTVGEGSALTHTATFTGNSGATAYTISDIIKHLKAIGMLLT